MGLNFCVPFRMGILAVMMFEGSFVTLCWRPFINPYSKLCRSNSPEILLTEVWPRLGCLGKKASHQPGQPLAVPDLWATFFNWWIGWSWIKWGMTTAQPTTCNLSIPLSTFVRQDLLPCHFQNRLWWYIILLLLSSMTFCGHHRAGALWLNHAPQSYPAVSSSVCEELCYCNLIAHAKKSTCLIVTFMFKMNFFTVNFFEMFSIQL